MVIVRNATGFLMACGKSVVQSELVLCGGEGIKLSSGRKETIASGREDSNCRGGFGRFGAVI